MEKKGLILGSALTLICAALIFFVGFTIGSGKVETRDVIVRDTLVKQVIVKEYIDRPVLKYVNRIRTDTIMTHFTDIRHDTVFAEIPIERRVYEEDSLYRATVTGYNPVLESLVIYPTVTTITITNTEKIKPSKFGFGVTVGPSALAVPAGKVYAGLGVTAGLQYRF